MTELSKWEKASQAYMEEQKIGIYRFVGFSS